MCCARTKLLVLAVLGFTVAACTGPGGGGTKAKTYDLLIDFSHPDGNGTVHVAPPGQDCSNDCKVTLDEGATVTLTATPREDTVFDGWSGACSGSTTTCTLTIQAETQVAASFSLPLPPAPTHVQIVKNEGDYTVSCDPILNAEFFLYLATQSGVTPENYASLPNGERRGPWPNPVNIAELLDGKTYYLVMTAKNRTGKGPPSAEVSFLFGTPPDPHLAWKYVIGGPIYYSSPAIGADGDIYVSTGAHFATSEQPHGVFAFHPDGTLKWQHLIGLNMFSPAVAPDGVYVQDASSTLYKLSLTDGSELWHSTMNAYAEVGQTAPAIDDPSHDAIYVAGEGVRALHADGTLRWTVSPAGATTIRSSPVISTDGSIYVGVSGTIIEGADAGAALYALTREGNVKWKRVFPGTESIFSSPAIASDGTIYIGVEKPTASSLYAVRPDGTVLWHREAPEGSGPYRSSAALGTDGTVYVGLKAGATLSGHVQALNPADGALLWSYDVNQDGADVYCSPTVGADGLIYFGAESSKLYALTPAGELSWFFGSQSGINWTSPAIASDGTLYVGDNSGNLFALHTTSLGLAASPWPKFRGDNANTGRQP